MNNLSKQFILILNKLEISGYRAAKDLGVTQTTIANIKKGTPPSSKIISTMVEFYGVNPMWLYMNEGEMFLSEEKKRLGIEEGDTDRLPESTLSLKLHHDNKTAHAAEPNSDYATKQTIQMDIYISKNEIVDIKGVKVVDSKDFD